jgi:hypothetical protein
MFFHSKLEITRNICFNYFRIQFCAPGGDSLDATLSLTSIKLQNFPSPNLRAFKKLKCTQLLCYSVREYVRG